MAISALLSTGGAGPAQHKSATFIPKTDRFPAHNNHKNTPFQLPLFHQIHSLYLIKASRKHRFTFRILQGALLTFSNLPKRQRPDIDSHLIQNLGLFFCWKAEYSPALLALGCFLSKAHALSDQHPDPRVHNWMSFSAGKSENNVVTQCQ